MSQANKGPSNLSTIGFVVALCFACAAALSILASALQERQEDAKELDRAKQMLLAAKVFHPDGYFLIRNSEGELVYARSQGGGKLVEAEEKEPASSEAIFAVYAQRIRSFLVDGEGKRYTFDELGINEKEYLQAHRKQGYEQQEFKLAYEILPNGAQEGATPEGYLFHVTGFGLWDAIYGYIAVGPGANEVVGISWYEHKETPGLGANISEKSWQDLFPGKQIFEPGEGGAADNSRAPLGITVVRGMVADVYGDGPKSQSAVDGMAGATLTGNGVTKAYKDTLGAYRPFLLKVQQQAEPHTPSAG